MSEIGDFIEARLKEDEHAASALAFACRNPDLTPDFGGCGGPAAEDYWARFSADRALREVELHRAVLSGNRTAVDWGADDCPPVVLLLAGIWRSHPDYRPAWAPGDAEAL